MEVTLFLVLLLFVQAPSAGSSPPVSLPLTCQDAGLYDPCTCSRDGKAGVIIVCTTFQYFQTLIKHWTCSHSIKVKIVEDGSEAWVRCGSRMSPLPRQPKVEEVNIEVVTKAAAKASSSGTESSQSIKGGLLVPNWSLVIIIVLAILIVLIIIKFSSKVRSTTGRLLGRTFQWARCLTPPFRPPGCEYDAFVCYSSQDNVFVEYILIPQLRSRGYKVFYHTRHFSPGERISDNIETGIKKSYCTIIVITTNLVRSGWSSYEFNRALREPRIGNRNHKVVPVVFGEDPNLNDSQMDPSLKEFLLQRSWLHWGTSFFWHRLALRLPTPRLGTDTPTDSDSLSALSACSIHSSPSTTAVSLSEQMKKHLQLKMGPDNEELTCDKQIGKQQSDISGCKKHTRKDSNVSSKSYRKHSRHGSDASDKSRKQMQSWGDVSSGSNKMHDEVKVSDSKTHQPVISATSQSANLHDVVLSHRATALCKDGSGSDKPGDRRFFSVKFKDKLFYIALKTGKVYVVSPVEDVSCENSSPSRRLQNYTTSLRNTTDICTEAFNYVPDARVYDVVKKDFYYKDKNCYNLDNSIYREQAADPSVENSRSSVQVPRSLQHVVHYKDLDVNTSAGVINMAYEVSENEVCNAQAMKCEPVYEHSDFIITAAVTDADKREVCGWV